MKSIPLVQRCTKVTWFFALILLSGCFFTSSKSQSAPPRYNCQYFDDAQTIPHIKATSRIEALACLGLLHGRDRLWQLDYLKRASQGRLAEILGKDKVEQDFVMRLMGLTAKANRLWNLVDSELKEGLEAYTYGVNHGAKNADPTTLYAFKALGHKFDKWEPQDSIAVVLLQSFSMTAEGFQGQFEEEEKKTKFGNQMDLFDRNSTPWNISIVKPGEQLFSIVKHQNTSKIAGLDFSALRSFRNVLKGLQGPGAGSNSWVTSGALNVGGAAILANDPHLPLSSPPFWYHVQLTYPGSNAIGATVPGVPAIISGTNESVSWGVTNSYFKVTDLTSVEWRDLPKLQTERPVIWVKMGPIQVPMALKTFNRTYQGYPILPMGNEERALILRWSGLDIEADELGSLLKIQESRSSSEIDQYLTHIGVPGWNFVFADVTGKIGFRTVGRSPKWMRADRKTGVAVLPFSAIDNRNHFPEMLNSSQVPQIMSPTRGYIVTANNPQWPEDYRFDDGPAHYPGFRALRIEELVKRGSLNVESHRKIQCDHLATDARILAPLMLATLDSQARSIPQALEIARWDFETGLDCKACPIFRRWIETFKAEQGVTENFLYRKLKNPSVDGWGRKAQDSFYKSLSELKLATQAELPTWGQVHLNFFDHLGGKTLFPRVPLRTPGDENTVNVGTSEYENGVFRQVEGSSLRHVVRMSRVPEFYFTMSGSQKDTYSPLPNAEQEKWNQCQLTRAQFPIDWNQAPKEYLVF